MDRRIVGRCPKCKKLWKTGHNTPYLDAPIPCGCEKEKQQMRTFDTGATRDTEEGKLDYEGFLSPLALRRYAEYMHKHRKQPDGKIRDSDNWQKGIPLSAYMKSLWRHVVDFWSIHRKEKFTQATPWDDETAEDLLCAIIFNASGYLHELLKGKETKFTPEQDLKQDGNLDRFQENPEPGQLFDRK